MSQEKVNRKLSCILSTDVVGYSRLMEENEASTFRYLEENKKLISKLIEEHNGRVVDSPGDNLLAEFSSAVKAVDCAVKIQKELKIKNAELVENRRMQFRIGINLGDVIEEEGRLYGSGVNIAARLESLADPGGICLTRNVYDQVKTKLDLGYEYLGEHSVKNISEPVRVYRVQTAIVAAENVVKKKVYGGLSGKIVIAAIWVILIGGYLIWKPYPSKLIKPDPASIESAQTTITTETKQAPKTIAVLPFEDLSPTKDQEYFSNGLAAELISMLGQVKGITIIDKYSAFRLKEKNLGDREIGETLDVTYLLKGSVRKSENQIRIDAKLIRASDGYLLFSKSYNGELGDILNVQGDIAKAVTTALSIKLGIGEFSRPGMTRNIKAYDEYLRADGVYSKYNSESILADIEQLKRAVNIDPGFGLGWYDLSKAYFYSSDLLPPAEAFDFKEKGVEAMKRARAIAPDMPELLIETALEYQESGNWLEAERIYKKILNQQVNANADVKFNYGGMLLSVGRNSDGVQYIQRAKRQNPLGGYTDWLVFALINANRIDEAIKENTNRRLKEELGSRTYTILKFLIALETNNSSGAAVIFNENYSLEGDSPDATMLELAKILLMEDKKAALSRLRNLSKRGNIIPINRMNMAHVASVLADPELAFMNFSESDGIDVIRAVWHPIHRGIRKLPAFKSYIREKGVYDYWRTTGIWGDSCHPVGDDFECD